MKFMIYYIFLFPMALMAQVKDDFTDGNFTSNPSWVGDTSDFTVNSQLQLQLNATGSDTSCLAVQNTISSGMEWSFWIKLSFNTSLNNFARVYLGSDSPDLKGTINAVYLQIGGSGDSIVLYRQSRNIHIPIFRLPFLRTNKPVNIFRIKIRRDSTGLWDLFADSLGGMQFISFGSFTDDQQVPAPWAGIFCRYTSSNSTKIYFDDYYAGRILPDTIPPRIISFGFSDSLTIRIKFSEYIDSACILNTSNFSLKNNPEKLSKAYILNDNQSVLFIKINTNENAVFCDSLRIKNISDFSNNLLADTSVLLCYYIPAPCSPGDIVINEVLFHPDAAGSKFIEFYNYSDKVINLNTLSVSTESIEKSERQSERLCSEERMLFPRDFYVITADSSRLCSRYYVYEPGKIFTMEHFPTMNSDSGSVFLRSNGDSSLIDVMTYNESMHLPFLVNTEGVSLERLDPELPSACRANWQSASETSGFASPGYENSHYSAETGKGMGIQLSSSIISPDNDGREDLLTISVNNVETGTLISIRIFDIRGNIVRTIASPSTVSENSIFIWNGTRDNDQVVNMGYYIVFAESISLSGRHSKVKQAVVVARKL